MKKIKIAPLSRSLAKKLQQKIDNKTKPLGSLGCLEDIALEIGLIQNTLSPTLHPHLLLFAGDHGIVEEGVSAYPQEVTQQMVFNFLNKGAAINVFCEQNKIPITIVDAGVNFNFSPKLPLIHNKIALGTKNFLNEPAMTEAEANECLKKGAAVVDSLPSCNIIGFGEMGIGNTSSASVLMHLLCNIPLKECVGKGAGLDNKKIQHKISTLKKAVARHRPTNTLEILATFGGFEIAQLCGAMLRCAGKRKIILVDGFISTAAFLTAYTLAPHIKQYAFFSHQSDEQGHKKMLHYLNATPLLQLRMRLGEGTGAALSFPLLQASVNFLTEMSSFAAAHVSGKVKGKK